MDEWTWVTRAGAERVAFALEGAGVCPLYLNFGPHFMAHAVTGGQRLRDGTVWIRHTYGSVRWVSTKPIAQD